MLHKLLLGTALAAFASIGSANAALMLKFGTNGGAYGLGIADNTGGVDLNPMAGAMTVLIGGGVLVSISSQFVGTSSEQGSIHLQVSGGGLGVLTDAKIMVSGTDFEVKATPQTLRSVAADTSLVGTTATFSTWYDINNAFFAQSTIIMPATADSTSGAPSPADAIVSPLLLADYSITEEIRLVFANSSSTAAVSLSTHVLVPEPASMTLLGAGLAGIGLLARRRRKAA